MKEEDLLGLNILCLLLMSGVGGYGDVLGWGEVWEKEVDTVEVNGKKEKSRGDNEVRGVGKVVKSSERVSKEEV
ncbi:hypothetical protein, partial [Neisseria sicca]|uniref:hypothetical protein n=1 Tax=Neisseria sicca TaxID=490 RepID=UPI0011BD1B95